MSICDCYVHVEQKMDGLWSGTTIVSDIVGKNASP